MSASKISKTVKRITSRPTTMTVLAGSMDVTEMVITHENAITHTLPTGLVPFQWRVD
jgi:hypothetical protein